MYTVLCLVFDSEGESQEIVSNTVKTSCEKVEFRYVAPQPSKILPCEGQYKLEVWGAKGGDSKGKGICNRESSPIVEGGLEGYSRGVLHLDEKETVHVFVVGPQIRTTDRSRSTACTRYIISNISCFSASSIREAAADVSLCESYFCNLYPML